MKKKGGYSTYTPNIRMFNNRKNALDFFKYDVELYPNSVKALEVLANFYREDNDWDRAIPLLEKAITLVSEKEEKQWRLSEKLDKFKMAQKDSTS